MLSLTKRSESQPDAAPLWHTNFRNFERLPDTKVVRTTFFINMAAIVVTLGLLLWLGYREFHIYTLGEQIAQAQKEIDSNSRQNKEAIRLANTFTEEEKKLADAIAFQRAPISPSEFAILLGQTLPKEISIEGVDVRLTDASAGIFIMHGLVAGTPDQASGAASSYVQMLHDNAQFRNVFDPINLEKLNRDAGSGILSFEISLKVKAESKEKK
jgi:hypothetical protein